MPEPLSLPVATREQLLRLQRRVWRVKILEGLLAGLAGLLASCIVTFALERWFETSALLRTALLAIGSVGLAVVFPWTCHRWVWRTRTLAQVAQIVKLRFPSLGDELLGVIELTRSEQDPGASRKLAAAAIQQVDRTVAQRDLTVAVPRPRVGWWLRLTAIPALGLLLAGFIAPAALANTVARWVWPWSNVPRYTFTKVLPLPTELIAAHGEPFQLTAQLDPASQWSPALAVAQLGRQPAIRAEQYNGTYAFTFPPQTVSDQALLRIGDVTTPLNVHVAHRPELNTLHAVIQLPDYLQYSHAIEADARGGVLTLLRGSQVSLTSEFTRELKRATLRDIPLQITGKQASSLPLAASETATLALNWVDELGLSPREPFPLRVELKEDAAPQATLQFRDAVPALLADDVLQLDVRATDDFGVRRLGIAWQGIEHPVQNPHPDHGERLLLAGGAEEIKLASDVAFRPSAENIRPQFIELRAFAEDALPGRPRTYSDPVVIQVLSPEAHAIWLMAQMRRWMNVSAEIYEEELRLNDANRKFRALSAAELNTPETRRAIEQQAAAERANGQRLQAANAEGDELIAQALHNPDLFAAQLETWAKGLRKMKSIAGERMPSVADLLSQAAQAPAGDTAAGIAGQHAPGQGDAAPANGSTGNPNVPQVVDQESGTGGSNEGSANANPAAPRFTLPQTTVLGGPSAPGASPANSPVDNKLQAALATQAELLAEFEKVRADFQTVMGDLENSTFVKRLKLASREQLDVATALQRTLLDSFGHAPTSWSEGQVEQFARLATREAGQGKIVRAIQTDMAAYYTRRSEEKLERIVKEMDELRVVENLALIGEVARVGRPGEAIARAEYWSDVLDRWAEEMVAASRAQEQPSESSSNASLPPSLVLEVMRILEGEMNLREETRTLDRSLATGQSEGFETRIRQQAQTQKQLQNRTRNVVRDITALPDGIRAFGNEISLLSAAESAMADAEFYLSSLDAGPDCIAAETEVIELLLQSRRAGSSGGGGTGQNPGAGSGGDTERAALELLGPTIDPLAKVESRAAQHATGGSHDDLPAEFRDGLDAFFQALEKGP